MSPNSLATAAVVLAYLIGSIPFAYVIVRAVKGIDIRTVGSGNVGATNASRVLGLKGFLAVFLLDLLKGLLPTIGFPALVRYYGGHAAGDLPILIALATILGHNFPVYLQFRGGKGVATSLGALLGLDWMAALVAVVVFGVSLRVNRYVSLSSVVGALAFVVVHFAEVIFLEKKSAWDRDHLAFSVLTLGLFAMLIWRHRKNWARIREGTEPKISRRRRAPSGRAATWLLAFMAVVGVVALLAMRLTRTASVDCGPFTLVDVGRVKTGHQRAIRPVFAEGGRVLGVLCPRYNRLMIYRVADDRSLTLTSDVMLDGQPMALSATRQGFLVLERPSGDSRHIMPGNLQGYDFDGKKTGVNVSVGYYPSEMAVIDDASAALVLTTGLAEGNAKLGLPALEVVDLKLGRVVSRVPFDRAGDNPWRISVASNERNVAVALQGSNEVAAIDLTDRSQPVLLGRTPLSAGRVPYPSIAGDEWILMPVESDRDFALAPAPGLARPVNPLIDYVVSVQVDESTLEVRKLASSATLGTLPLRGSGNFTEIRPTGVACSPERGLIAVTSRSGGVHMIAMQPKDGGSVGKIAGHVEGHAESRLK
ncbi:MAG: acyl-phosphate glycerol 3-phosphate acyltransferase [Planctomycetota bacterium]|nr:acyl-phosphate glycerol 3-phosphate acyltransferase [Planctomycetota bacterium]